MGCHCNFEAQLHRKSRKNLTTIEESPNLQELYPLTCDIDLTYRMLLYSIGMEHGLSITAPSIPYAPI